MYIWAIRMGKVSRFLDFCLGDLYLTHVSKCDWNMWREDTCIKKHIHHTGSGIVPYISYTSIQQHLLPEVWLKQLPPDTAPTFCRFRAGAPAVPRHKLPRYGVLSYDPPGRGHPTPCGRGDSEVWAWWWSGEWQFLVFFLGWAGLILARFKTGGLQVVFYFRFDVYTDIYIACLYII